MPDNSATVLEMETDYRHPLSQRQRKGGGINISKYLSMPLGIKLIKCEYVW